jgi:hypothetical protein
LTSITRVELLQRHLLQPRVLGDAGVVDQHVDAAELFLDAGDHGIDRFALRHVHLKAGGGRAERLALRDDLVHRRLLDVADDDDGAFLGEFQRGGQTDALGGAGDDGNLVFKGCDRSA